MSVPLFWNEDNIPIGVQFAGRFGDEATLFRFGTQLEKDDLGLIRYPLFIAANRSEIKETLNALIR